MSPLSASEVFNVNEKKFRIDIDYIIERNKNYKIEVNELFKLIVKGFYPGLNIDKKINSNLYYSSYVQTYIESMFNRF